MKPTLSISQCVTLACLLEATAPKPGNVHRGADFDDLTFHDFVVSAALVGPLVAEAQQAPVGATILAAVRATREHVGTNTNLGMLLLLTPLAAVPRSTPLQAGIPDILQRLTPADARDVYAAINLAASGALGQVEQYDLHDAPPENLLDAMRLAASHDSVARQYVENFQAVFEQAAKWLREGPARGWSLTDTIIHTHVRLLSVESDSLIRRKCGEAVAAEVSRRAAEVLALGVPDGPAFRAALADFDFWLRCDGHRRNPGTTADLIAAGLFVGLREGWLLPPYR